MDSEDARESLDAAKDLFGRVFDAHAEKCEADLRLRLPTSSAKEALFAEPG
jgi:hypothetical protein